LRAIDYIDLAYADFPLCNKFVEHERQILREATVAQVSLRSDTLRLMIKLFVSEMEGEGRLYIGSLENTLGYREEGGWIGSWEFKIKFMTYDTHVSTPLDELRRMDCFMATCDVQLRCELEWFVLNLQLIVDHFNPNSDTN